ncbi:MAG: glycosyltransferase [Acidobacteria bacterium]|nr:MAG: glycosyltransferase [Acidobacteriota bacterium]
MEEAAGKAGEHKVRCQGHRTLKEISQLLALQGRLCILSMAEILFISPRWPWPLFDGGRIRIYETLRHLAARHRVTLLAPVREVDNNTDRGPIPGLCAGVFSAVRSDRLPAVATRLASGLVRGVPLVQSFFLDKGLAGTVRDLTSSRHFDIIHVEYPVMAAYLDAVDPICGARWILSTHNIESIRFDRETRFSSWDSRRLLLVGDQLFFKSWEAKAIRRFHGVTAVSDLEKQWIEKNAPGAEVELVPNGVDADYFDFTPPGKSHFLTFIGSMDYPPNIDAVLWFGQEILPRLLVEQPDLQFRVVGSRPDRRVMQLKEIPGIEITGQVPDIRPYLKDSLALVVPLRSGGGTRLKILQAMAAGCPVVSTTIGAEGLDVTPDLHFLKADSLDAWVAAVRRLDAPAGSRTEMAKAGRALVDDHYTWSKCLSGLDRLYEKVMKSPVENRPTEAALRAS